MQSPLRGIQSSSKREQRLQKYLKPGALARLRDARISARSQTFMAARRCFMAPNADSSASSARANLLQAASTHLLEETPCFKVRSFGPCFPQRKKLVASKGFFMAISHSIPSSPTGSAGMVEALDTFSPPPTVDILVVH